MRKMIAGICSELRMSAVAPKFTRDRDTYSGFGSTWSASFDLTLGTFEDEPMRPTVA